LNLDTLISDIVEDEFVAIFALIVDSATNPNFDIFLMLARLERVIILDEIPEIVVDLELVRIRVWVLGLAEFVNGSRPDLEVLLSISLDHCAPIVSSIT
jgi:hypothetical protein